MTPGVHRRAGRLRRPVRAGSDRHHPPGAGLRHRRRGHQAEDRLSDGQARHRGHRLRGHVRQRRHLLRREAAVSSWTTSPAARMCPEKIAAHRGAAWPRAASRRAARSSAARPPRCRASTRRTNTTWRALPWAWWTGAKSWTTPQMQAGRRAHRAALLAACTPTAFRWCARSSMWRSADSGSHYDELGRTLGEALLDAHKHLCQARAGAAGAGAVCAPSATSPAAAFMRTSPARWPRAARRRSKRQSLRIPPIFALHRRRRATFPSGTCSTPSTWAWAWLSSCPADEADEARAHPEGSGRGRVCPGRDREGRKSGVELC